MDAKSKSLASWWSFTKLPSANNTETPEITATEESRYRLARGYAFLDRGLREHALRELETAIMLDPGNAAAAEAIERTRAEAR